MKFGIKKISLVFMFLLVFVTGFFLGKSLDYRKDYSSDLLNTQTDKDGEEVKGQEYIFELDEGLAIKKGIDFLLNPDEKFVRGSPVYVKKMNEICKNADLENAWKKKFDDDIGDYKFLYKLCDFNPTSEEISPDFESVLPLSLRVIAKAIYCENFSYEDIIKDINQIERDGSFNSIYLLFSLGIMKENKCYSEELLEPLTEDLINRFVVLQWEAANDKKLSEFCDSGEFDKYVARAAFISYAGYPIRGTWLENILACQMDNGSWLDNSHTTSLALWTLIQEKGACE